MVAPDVSVIMACRNEAPHIRDVLDSLLTQHLNRLRAEFLIADGASTDGTREIIAGYSRAHRGMIALIDNPRKIVSTGLNLAIQAARAPIILRVDAHTEYAPDYIATCVAALHSTGAGNVGGPARTHASGWIAEAIAAAYHSPFSCGGARFHQEDFEGWVDTVTYGCWRKETLVELGLFDESLVRNQDDELNLRLIRSGRRIWQSPSIVSYYHPRSSFCRLFKQYFEYGFWKVRVIQKHHLPASPRHLVPGLFVLSTILLPLFGAIYLWLVILAAYAAASVMASILTAKHYGWRLLPILPLVFAVYHYAYGTGFLAGIVRFLQPHPVRQ